MRIFLRLFLLLALVGAVPAYAVPAVGNGNTSCPTIGSGTFATAKALTGVSICSHYFATDLGTGVDIVWNGAAWKPAGGSATIYQSGTATSFTGTATTENAVVNLAIPPGLLAANASLRVTVLFSYTSTTSIISRIRFSASTGITGTSVQATTATNTFLSNRVQPQITNRTATNSQVANNAGSGPFSTSTGTVVASAIDTTSQSFINITATLTNTTDIMTVESYTVEWIAP